ncbi:MAG: hypothetical protein QN141_01665 [Armatimonadota bacterium]|nr:hypothetical protein [Armatimonadota bacterium]MDR7451011.1 hypothetical protein [Armatimonadota bacterium]MDR7465968.1 hypothetical protein [Armatimonadota bacterium]MDR7494033.1 hypothetical protein [Armatimonadota bacterium]MDR7498483.1 hypothetical protein [Armatimonadota bacterium]
MRGGEEILVVPRAVLLPEPVHGFITQDAAEYLARIRAEATFRRRNDVEDDPSMKQIIPYLIVRHGGQIFVFQRTQRITETRLRGKFSIGIGGHINRSDVAGAGDVLEAGLRRELAEELVVDGPWAARFAGVLNDDSNDVGRVHFGLVYVVDTAAPAIAVREPETLAGWLTAPGRLRDLYDRMETWSQLILDAVDPMRL